MSTYQVWSFWSKGLLSYHLHKVWETDMTFNLGLWPTDLNLYKRDHLLTKDYLPTKLEASGAKSCWVISCTRCVRLTWPFTQWAWISIGIIFSPRTVYQPSLKVLGLSVVELSVAQGVRDWLDLWPTDHLLIKDCLPVPTKFEASGGKALLSYQLLKVKGYRPTCAKQYAPPSWKGGGIMTEAWRIK